MFAEFATGELLEDVAGRGEKAMCKEFAKDCAASAARRDDLFRKVEVVCAKRYPKAKASCGRPAPKAKAFLKKCANSSGDQRWWNSLKGDTSFIMLHAPSAGSCLKDDDNGRFLISYPGHGGRRSISWTKRGMNVASIEALRVWWGLHLKHSGQAPPEQISALWASP